jgi:epoxyqueuosine reductase
VGSQWNLAAISSETIKRIARESGFELVGIASADPPEDFARFESWNAQGHAGEMRYLTDRRAEIRRDVRNLLPSARSVICVGKLYNQRAAPAPPGHAVISRYAWGHDYHEILRSGLEKMVDKLSEHAGFDWKICVDTAPLLERTFARLAGLGWIGKNTCLINEPLGSWFFLGELITSLDVAPDSPPPDRCGTCTRCINACPTDAFVPAGDSWAIDSRRCIAYFTIELRGAIPEEFRASMGPHVFGCDICQDVCPWNRRAPIAADPELAPRSALVNPALEGLAAMDESAWERSFNGSPVRRARFSGFRRNLAIAMGNSGQQKFLPILEEWAHDADPVLQASAHWAERELKQRS